VVKPGRILYEMSGAADDISRRALLLAGAKLPVLTRVVHRDEQAL